MLPCLFLIRVQRAWFSGAAGWKRCLVCDKSNLGLWFIKCLQNNNRKANRSTQGAPEFCRGENTLYMQSVGTEFMFCLCVVGTHYSENVTENAAFGRELLNASLSWRGLICLGGCSHAFQNVLCWGRSLLWGSALRTFPVSHTLSPCPFEISSVCVCMFTTFFSSLGPQLHLREMLRAMVF